MAIDFPNSPTVGQLFTVNDIARRWDGTTWSIVPTTIQGVTGAKGPQGTQGTTGIQGTQGLQGRQGITGAGLYTFSSTPPSSPNVGDRWIDSDTGNEYTYIDDGTSFQWVDTRPSGYMGAQGIQGATGSQGIQGTTGIQGPISFDEIYLIMGAY